MRIDFSHNYADVSSRDNGTHFVAVHFPEVGFHVHGIRVVPSKRDEGKYVVYKPAIRTLSGGFKTNYEYANSSELWQYIKEIALKAVDESEVTSINEIDDIDFDKELSKAIDNFQGGVP